MYKQLIFLSCIFLVSFSVGAKDYRAFSLASVDSATYQMWVNKEHKNLIELGKKALRQDIDFYYLRVRMGIAFYEKKNYHKAATHFEKALAMNNSEDYVKEYLYYSYLLANRTMEAGKLSDNFSADLHQKLNITNPLIKEINISYNQSFNDKDDYNDFDFTNIVFDEGSQYIPLTNQYYGIGIKHSLFKNASVNHILGRMNNSYYTYEKTDGIGKINDNYKSSLNQYYGNLELRLWKNLNLNGGIHFVNNQVVIQSVTKKQGREGTSSKIVANNDMVYFIKLTKSIPYFDFSLAGYYSTLNDFKQFQKDLTIVFYPNGNNHLYFKTIFTHHTEDFGSSIIKNNWIYQQTLGVKVYKQTWLEGNFMKGKIHDFLAGDGAMVYDSPSFLNLQFGGKVLTALTKNINLFFDYTQYQGFNYFYSKAQNGLTNPIKTNNQSYTGGILWNF